MVFPFGMGVIVGVRGTGVNVGGMDVGVCGAEVPVGATGVAIRDGLGPQPFNARERTIARRNRLVIFFIVPSIEAAERIAIFSWHLTHLPELACLQFQ